jgi:hypothetical protein
VYGYLTGAEPLTGVGTRWVHFSSQAQLPAEGILTERTIVDDRRTRPEERLTSVEALWSALFYARPLYACHVQGHGRNPFVVNKMVLVDPTAPAALTD